MGGCFTVYLQGRHSVFDGVAILGFSAIHTVLPSRPGDVSSDPFRYAFHYPDVPREVVDTDMTDYPSRQGTMPVWGAATVPPCAATLVQPGVVAEEAAAIDVPVFIGVGEIDVVPDPRAEPNAYSNSPDITVFVAPRMAHMHNFAGTRTMFWDRLAAWASGVRRRPLD
jgi:pimeloyl-ACP methyl ester carboxylesterase